MEERRGGFVHSAFTLAGLVLGWQFGGWIGARYFKPGPLAFLLGFCVTVMTCALLGKWIASRETGNGGGTSPLGLWLRGLGWRAVARLVLALVIIGPPAAIFWAWRSGWIGSLLEKLVTGVI
jgi:hypothetical protein